ncbi:hypothetical protein BGZ99_002348, partial [Dissophora globulifera]
TAFPGAPRSTAGTGPSSQVLSAGRGGAGARNSSNAVSIDGISGGHGGDIGIMMSTSTTEYPLQQYHQQQQPTHHTGTENSVTSMEIGYQQHLSSLQQPQGLSSGSHGPIGTTVAELASSTPATAGVVAMNRIPPAALMDLSFNIDLKSLLSSDIHTLGLQDCLSPSLPRSASSSPSPSTASSSSTMSSNPGRTRSPPLTLASSAPVTPSQSSTSLLSASQQSSLLGPRCPAAGCSKAFVSVYQLNTHMAIVHGFSPRDSDDPNGMLSAPWSASTGSTGAFPPPSPLSSSPSPLLPPSQVGSTSSTPPPTVASAAPGPDNATNSNKNSGNENKGNGNSSSKPFPCHLCPRIFSRKHDLQRHIRVHTGSKPYVCMNCQKSFSRTDALCRHYKIEERCRQVVEQLEADQSIRKLQQNHVQQTLLMEVKEMQKAQKLRMQRQQQQQIHMQIPSKPTFSSAKSASSSSSGAGQGFL